jgi:zinc transport system ATP-binding protein
LYEVLLGKLKPIIDVENLSIARNGRIVIEDATFKIEPGAYMGVVGPNGGGKTTLMQALLGILPAEKGSIELMGKPIDDFTDWSQLAFVSQHSINFNDKFPLTVRELVGLGRINRGNLGRPLKNADWVKVDEALNFMGIKKLSNRRIGQLSGGQKQRVFVAKAIVRDPKILLLDEPASGIDPEAQERFYMILANLNAKHGTTILIVSHDLAAVFCRMNYIMCINKNVYTSSITPDTDPNEVLQKAYGPHFHFVFHEHICEGVFEDV